MWVVQDRRCLRFPLQLGQERVASTVFCVQRDRLEDDVGLGGDMLDNLDLVLSDLAIADEENRFRRLRSLK